MRLSSPGLTRVALATLLSACAGGGAPPASAGSTETDGDEPGSTRASREAARAETPPSATSAPPLTPEPRALFTLVPLGAVAEAEDGSGAVVTSSDAVAVDLDSHRFPARALDPVLWVGSLRFRHYVYPAAGVLRFVVAHRSVLERGEEMAVQYGEDTRSRVVLSAGPSPSGVPSVVEPGAVAP